jgi:hypothetical protein
MPSIKITHHYCFDYRGACYKIETCLTSNLGSTCTVTRAEVITGKFSISSLAACKVALVSLTAS